MTNSARTDAAELRQRLRIGTSRAGQAGATLAAPLDTLTPPAGTATPEARLWLSLAALDVWERSGFAPGASKDESVAPRRRRTRPRNACVHARSRAESLLTAMLRGLYPADLIEQWLRHLKDYGGRAPAAALPALLDLGARQPALQPLLMPVLGERGRWVARHEPSWDWAAGTTSAALAPSLWETGSPDERLRILRAWRADDPAAALAALAKVWSSEPPEQRAALLPVLREGLRQDDEPFLEAALDDRRKEVRAAARIVLAQLPASRFTQRMLGRLTAALQLERPSSGAPRLEVVLPAECDAAARRDGIGAGYHPGLGEKAGWVTDMLALVDPRIWPQRFGVTPGECLALAERGESAGVLVRGWGLAVLRLCSDGAAPPDAGLRTWLHDLLRWGIGAKLALGNVLPDGLVNAAARMFTTDPEGALSDLIDTLPHAWREDAYLSGMLQRLADGAPDSWAPAPSRRMLQRLDAILMPGSPGTDAWAVKALSQSLARALDAPAAYAMATTWQDRAANAPPDDAWRRIIDQFFDTVRLRHEIILSFQEPA